MKKERIEPTPESIAKSIEIGDQILMLLDADNGYYTDKEKIAGIGNAFCRKIAIGKKKQCNELMKKMVVAAEREDVS